MYHSLLQFLSLVEARHQGVEVEKDEISECFAEYFDNKIQNLLTRVNMDPLVYNGTRKIQSDVINANFMTSFNIRKAVLSLKMKNAEGDDSFLKCKF